MYYWLSREIKRRLAYELKKIFVDYPTLDKFTVHDKFPYGERVQFGVVFKNVTGDPIPLSGDNFITTVYSHVFTAKVKDKKGLIFDWVREDESITELVQGDVSSQADGSNRTFTLADAPVQGDNNTEPANSPRQVKVTVNGVNAVVNAIDGQQIVLAAPPPAGALVIAQYFRENIVAPGLYYFEVTKDFGTGSFEVMIDTLLEVESIIIASASGGETTFQLQSYPVYPQTFELLENDRALIEGTHYTLNYDTGLITFLPNPDDPAQTLAPGRQYSVGYRYQGPSMGPYNVTKLQSGVGILPGITLAFSNWLQVGDKQVVIVTKTREESAQEFGGKFDLSITLDVYARDPIQRELVADLLVVKLFGELKPKFDGEGLLVVRVTPTGETEDIYDENTDTPYYMAGIDISIQADWNFYVPLVPKIKFVNAEVIMVPSINDFKVAFVPSGEKIRG